MKVYCDAPRVPEALQPLLDLAYNFWWTRVPEAVQLFESMCPPLWRQVQGNAVRFLRLMGDETLSRHEGDPAFLHRMQGVHNRFTADVGDGECCIQRGVLEMPVELHPLAAYFSAEFGLHESLPIYSGGLGILAGDHVKATSDLQIPFVGMGLLYRQGYFRQRLNLEGWQYELYEDLPFHDLALREVLNEDETPLLVTIHLPDRDVKARVWLAMVGRSALFLLDSYVLDNWREDRLITNRLYDSDRKIRLLQEILLGVGGVRVLEALNITPRRFHMNEGHSAFLVLERAAQLIRQKDITFEEARELTRSSNVFTTHTPVAAGHEIFEREIMEPMFRPQLERLKLTADEFFALGHRDGNSSSSAFEMTALAIHFSDRINGVSRLHGEVARKQWAFMWPDRPVSDVPIGHVTNGIDLPTWIGPAMRDLFARHLAPDWENRLLDEELWNRVDSIPDSALWEALEKQRIRLVTSARRRCAEQLRGRNVDTQLLNALLTEPHEKSLTIGFARRFATYKRATLIFRDVDRLARLFADRDRPIQIIYAGKAHPADEGGKRLIQDIVRLAEKPPFRGRVLFIENYDIGIARELVQGADVWLNTPRPPKEASGTSGMKACPNGALTLSTRDGWWVEGATQSNGWTIGDGRFEGRSEEELDAFEAESLMSLLENEVIPLFFDRDARGLPVRWLARVRESIRTITPFFNTARMVREYAETYYTR
ncbi:MAG TPA: alpha-glucan family phosphorylase [Planctomycetes bacterium]|nr:alpha-glucan family phosphorylase [Planctomycetota bacterium]